MGWFNLMFSFDLGNEWHNVAHQEALKKELERLRNIYNQQSTENMVE